MRDISEVRALEQLKSDFVATVSHELRTPLTSIRGYVELLLEDGETLTGDQRQAISEVLTEVEVGGTEAGEV